jgi:hypothetical protein
MGSQGRDMPFTRPYPPRIAVILGLAVACGLAVVLCVGLSIRLGQNLPVVDVGYDYVVALVVAVVLGALILLWPLQPLERKVCLSLWLLKMFMTLVVMLWYESHYEILDSFGYFRDSLQPSRDFTVLNLAVGTEIMSRFFSRLWLVMPESYHAAKVVCAYFGLAAFVMFGRAFELMTSRPRVHFLIVLGIFPSMLFWSSIAGKDPLILFGIAGATYAVASWYHEGGRWLHPVLFIVAALLTALVRPWIGAMLVLSFLFAAVVHFVRRNFGAWGIWLLALAGMGCAILALMALSSQMGALLLALEATTNAFAGGGSAVNAPLVFSSWKDVLVFLPVGVFTALFRPLPGEVANAFGLLAGLENVLLLALTAGVAWWVCTGRSGRAWQGRPVILWLLLMVAMWAGLYAFLSYQNLGTGVRFKAQVLPLLFLLFATASIRPGASGGERGSAGIRGAMQ